MKLISWDRLPGFVCQSYLWAVHCCYSVLAGLTVWFLAMMFFSPNMGSGVLMIVAALTTVIICTLAYGKSPRCCIERETANPYLSKHRYNGDCGSYPTASKADVDPMFLDI